ncbi:hypothetical protein [Pelobacter seleniigenes]|uniref:hypothetical protein n=1 Tax=Pelobacter seleniigenes TaxID=407188 RepID=UPI0004A752E1|nr:hypothetical protein [Pelobacter seleniigenes]
MHNVQVDVHDLGGETRRRCRRLRSKSQEYQKKNLLQNIAKKRTMPIHNWRSALNQFSIMFEEHMPFFWPAGYLHNLLYGTAR